MRSSAGNEDWWMVLANSRGMPEVAEDSELEGADTNVGLITMSEVRKAPALRLLLELAVVFVGVLVALLADSWWEGREDRVRERSYLMALQSDMADASLALSEALRSDSVRLKQGVADLAVLRGEAVLDPGASLTSLLDFQANRPALRDGTLRALVNSGDLKLIRSESVRTTLVAEAAEFETDLTWIDEVMSQMATNVREVLVAWERLGIAAQASGQPLSLEMVRSDPTVVAGRLVYLSQLTNLLESKNGLLAAAKRIQDAVTEELRQ